MIRKLPAAATNKFVLLNFRTAPPYSIPPKNQHGELFYCNPPSQPLSRSVPQMRYIQYSRTKVTDQTSIKSSTVTTQPEGKDDSFVTSPLTATSSQHSSQEELIFHKPDESIMVESPYIHNMIAGSTAGLVCCLLFYPLESTEARMQVARKEQKKHAEEHDPQLEKKANLTFFGTFRDTIRTEGVRALYKGVTPTALGATWNSAWYFSLYESFKRVVHDQGWWALEASKDPSMNATELVNHVVHYSTSEMIVAAMVAGIICTFLVNPFYTLKMRMLTQTENHRSMMQTLKHMVQTEGVLSLWKGVVPSLFGTTEGAIQLAVFENLTRMLGALFVGSALLGAPSSVHFISGFLSKAVSTLLTYPYQVIRARLMAAHSPYTGLMDCIRKTKLEGWRAFYQGLLPNLTRQLTPAGIFFMVYNLVKKLLGQFA